MSRPRISKRAAEAIMAAVVRSDPKAGDALRTLNIHIDAAKDLPGRYQEISFTAFTYAVTIGSAESIRLSDTTVAAARRLLMRIPSAHRKQIACKVAGAGGSAAAAAAMGLGLPSSGEAARDALAAIGEAVIAAQVHDTARGLPTDRATMRNDQGKSLLRDAAASDPAIARARLDAAVNVIAILDRADGSGPHLTAEAVTFPRRDRADIATGARLAAIAGEIATRCDGPLRPEKEWRPSDGDTVVLTAVLPRLAPEQARREEDECRQRIAFFLTGIRRTDLLGQQEEHPPLAQEDVGTGR